MENQDMPMGFSFSMFANEKALDHFAKMNEEERTRVIEQARNVTSKREMEQLIQRLGEGDSFC